MDDLLGEFLTETAESIDVVDNELVKFEQNPQDKAILDNIFRLVHTIKGTCGFLGLPRLEAVAHAAETVLGKYRDGELEVTAAGVSLILESLDKIKSILSGLETDGVEPEGDDADLIARLDAAAKGDFGAGEAAEPTETADLADAEEDVSAEEVEVGQDVAEPAVIEAGAAGEPVKADASAKPSDNGIKSQSIRVNVDLLENLMTMVSELVLTRNQLLQMVRALDDSEFTVPLQQLSNVTAELQDAVMKTRMQPIGNAWQKLPRIVRDVGQDVGKKISLVMDGQDTELDRQVLELIKDPLTHMVRNSADHGLESPEDRLAKGKPETGTINLRAYHEGGHIIIQVSDDGQGLNTEKIREKVLGKGLATAAELDAMSDNQIQRFIFAAGFSTAEAVTNLSGRGVGMDVVRTNIELIGGAIDLVSEKDKGTAFTIKIPLTLAIVSALIVEACGSRFAIPQLSVVELVRTGMGSEHLIETINATKVLRLRDRLLPLIDLNVLLGEQDVRNLEGESHFVVVMQVGERRFGIVVDNVFDTEEIVVKPVASALRDIAMFSGNTILGDGSVIMIIDPNGVASAAALQNEDAAGPEQSDRKAAFTRDDTTALLVFRAGSQEPKAAPLALITRLEEIDRSTIEYSNGRALVQYRGRLMPIVFLSGADATSEGQQPILVFTDQDRSMGLAVDEILDIVEQKLDVEIVADQSGTIGSAIVKERATEIVDVAYYLSQAYGDWFSRTPAADVETRAKRVLLVDDNAFFRNMIAPLLGVAGYELVAVESAADALALREAGEVFDLIVSDIEMPDCNGFEFAQ
ncbi:MAG: hybrid sensor histidine kinase/response regulator, partial [Pseudomonadota bacterium]